MRALTGEWMMILRRRNAVNLRNLSPYSRMLSDIPVIGTETVSGHAVSLYDDIEHFFECIRSA